MNDRGLALVEHAKGSKFSSLPQPSTNNFSGKRRLPHCVSLAADCASATADPVFCRLRRSPPWTDPTCCNNPGVGWPWRAVQNLRWASPSLYLISLFLIPPLGRAGTGSFISYVRIRVSSRETWSLLLHHVAEYARSCRLIRFCMCVLVLLLTRLDWRCDVRTGVWDTIISWGTVQVGWKLTPSAHIWIIWMWTLDIYLDLILCV